MSNGGDRAMVFLWGRCSSDFLSRLRDHATHCFMVCEVSMQHAVQRIQNRRALIVLGFLMVLAIIGGEIALIAQIFLQILRFFL
jgi:hypothetical protein